MPCYQRLINDRYSCHRTVYRQIGAHHFNLAQEIVIEEVIRGDRVSYLKTQESEFFSSSQQVLDQLLHIKERIAAKYTEQ